MNNEETRKWLDTAWRDALEARETEPDPRTDRLTNSRVISIRYALVTQILGKIADPGRNVLTLQLSASDEGAWDARSFSTAVVVPWVEENYSILGTSSEPYASKPLRRPRLAVGMPDVRSRNEWDALVEFLAPLEDASPEELRNAFRRVLASVARKLTQETFVYPVPRRVSLPQLQETLKAFLAVSSRGLRPLAVTSALFETLGRGFSLFSRVESQGLNEPDAASGMPGDVMCYDGDRICLVVEVKDADLTLAHVRTSVRKAKGPETGLSSLLFAVPGVRIQDADEIGSLGQRNWASGLNIYTADILGLSQYTFTLLKEEWRVSFLQAIGAELDARQDQAARKDWHGLLEKLG